MSANFCPWEIWQHVFQFACVDDGTTGRSLSLVCKSFYEISKGVKLQCLAIFGARQIFACADMLERTPLEYRKVRHLFISVPPPDGDLQVARRDRNQTYSSDKAEYDLLCEAYVHLMEAISPSVESIYCIHTLTRAVVILPVSMPCLVKLTFSGPCPTDPVVLDNTLPTFPSLRQITLMEFYDYPIDLFERIAYQAPSLTHLFLRFAHIPRHLPSDLKAALKKRRQNLGGEGSRMLPARVVIQAGPEPAPSSAGPWLSSSYRDMMERLARIADGDNRLVLASQDRPLDLEETKRRWLESLP